MRVIFLLLLSAVFSFALKAGELPKEYSQDCEITYGTVLGKSVTGIEAYSNCSDKCVNPAPFFIDKTFTGIQWQCVEYARRWLLLNLGVVYGDVDVAADIWQLDYVMTSDKKSTKAFKSILNGDKQHYAQRGDLLIYSRAFLSTGHVAVVVKVDEKNQRIYLAEQNFSNQVWPGDYARYVSYIIHEGGMWLLDPYLIGWKRVITD